MTSLRTRLGPAPAGYTWLGGIVLAVLVALLLDLRATDGGRILAQAGWGSAIAAVGLIFGGAGSVLLAHRPRHPVGIIMAGFGLFWAVDGLLESWTALSYSLPDRLPGTAFAFWFVSRFGAFLLVALPLLLLVYPEGRLPAGRLRLPAALALAAAALLPIALVLAPGSVLNADGATLPPDLAVDLWPPLLPEPVAYTLLVVTRYVTFSALLVPVVLLVLRHRRAGEAERRALRWLLWAGVVCVLLVGVSVLLPSTGFTTVALVLATAITAASITIGILRPDLTDVDALVAGTLVYAGTAAAVLLADLALLAAATALLGDRLSQREVTVALLLFAVVFYGPLRSLLARLARRGLVGRRGDRYRVVSSLAARLEESGSVPDQLPALAATVAEVFKLSFVGVEVLQPGGQRLTAEHGTRPVATQELAITYRGRPVGRLLLPATGVRALLSRADQQLLVDVVRQAAIAVRNATLATALQESRERLVLDREEDRRRIRRDLHDGLGPVLAGVGLRLDAARNAVTADPERARGLIAVSRSDLSEAAADVRRLVHGLRPPAIDDLGLLAAVRQQAERAESSGLRVSVVAEALPPLPAAVEVAAYRIIAEALTNVLRHAQAGACRVRLAEDDGVLVVEVTDDGRGIPPDRTRGVGLQALRERAAELGGESEVTCPPDGGTRVRAVLPLTASGALVDQ